MGIIKSYKVIYRDEAISRSKHNQTVGLVRGDNHEVCSRNQRL